MRRSSFSRVGLGNLTTADLSSTDFSRADLRSTTEVLESLEGWLTSPLDFLFPADATTITRNMIWPDGEIRSLNLRDGEALTIRNDEMPIRVSDRFEMADTSIFEIKLDAAEWGSTITVGEDVSTQLGGTLLLQIADAIRFEELVGRNFDLFDWASTPHSDGGFDAIHVPPGTQWDLSQLYTTGEVSLIAVPEPQFFPFCVLFLFTASCRRVAKQERK